MTLLLVESARSTDARFTGLLAKAREGLNRPWLGAGIEPGGRVETAMRGQCRQNSTHARPRAADRTDPGRRHQGNPRQIKRFLNALFDAARDRQGARLRRQTTTAGAREVHAGRTFPAGLLRADRTARRERPGRQARDALARSRRHPRASTGEEDEEEKPAAKGRVRQAAGADAAADRSRGMDEERMGEGAGPAIDPPLADMDLRPYVFVTRDKRSSSAASPPRAISKGCVEKLWVRR